MASSYPVNLVVVNGAAHFQELLSRDLQRVSLINFWAPWAEPCRQMNEVVVELARRYEKVLVLEVDADTHGDIAESFEIEAVPSFVILRGHTLLGRIGGADAAALTSAVATHTREPLVAQSQTTLSPEQARGLETEEELTGRMRGLMGQSRVVLFMKGAPDAPRCGFSRQAVALLRAEGVEFAHFDILTDERVRQGLKELNSWPTFPQVIVKGEFVGGLDVLKESVESGEFRELLAAD